MNKDKDKTEEAGKDAEALDKAAEEEKAAMEREQEMLANQKISMKMFKEFKYYPMIFFPPCKALEEGQQGTTKRRTILNVNVGGQIFRMK